MQRTYLALATLAAGAALTALQGLPLRANTVPSRAPLAQNQPTGRGQAGSLDPELMLRLAAAAVQAAEPSLPPPPPVFSSSSEATGIVALEVVPYRP